MHRHTSTILSVDSQRYLQVSWEVQIQKNYQLGVIADIKYATILHGGLCVPMGFSGAFVPVGALRTTSLHTIFSAWLPLPHYALVQHLRTYKRCAHSSMYVASLYGSRHDERVQENKTNVYCPVRS